MKAEYIRYDLGSRNLLVASNGGPGVGYVLPLPHQGQPRARRPELQVRHVLAPVPPRALGPGRRLSFSNAARRRLRRPRSARPLGHLAHPLAQGGDRCPRQQVDRAPLLGHDCGSGLDRRVLVGDAGLQRVEAGFGIGRHEGVHSPRKRPGRKPGPVFNSDCRTAISWSGRRRGPSGLKCAGRRRRRPSRAVGAPAPSRL